MWPMRLANDYLCWRLSIKRDEQGMSQQATVRLSELGADFFTF
jgi:hypothetical protein